jgi:hypothetical protein
MPITRSITFILISLVWLPRAAPAADYARKALLTGTLTVRDSGPAEAALAGPLSRRYDMAQLDVVFSTDTKVKYTLERGGFSSTLGVTTLVVTFVAADGKRYDTDIVIGRFYANGVLPRFKTLPPRNVPLRKIIVSGMNVPPIRQIYWLDGREKLSGETEDAANCAEGKCRWREAADYCASRGGRLLTVAELKNMYAAECEGRELDACRAWYWAAAEYAQYPRNAWYVDFMYGQAAAAPKTTTAYVRCFVPSAAAGGVKE